MTDFPEGSTGAPAGQAAASEPRRTAEGLHFGLRRAAELVQAAAYEMAGRASAAQVSRLIEIAAELDRLARATPDDPGPGSG